MTAFFRLRILLVLFLTLNFWSIQNSYSQDPFFTHFYNNRSHFNPALTGISGSFSLNAKHKSQWKGAAVPAFRSTSVTIEETVLCHFLDYGFFFNHDQEGAGVFETFEPGFRFAGTLPFLDGLVNIRFGGSMMWGWKRIDFTKLIFSDQLDPRYGFQDLPSSFIPPDDGVSQSYISPGVGASFRSVIGADRSVIFDIQGGMALHNGFSIGREKFGHTESILDLDARIPVRWNAFFDTNIFFTGNGYRSFFSINPQVIYQNQAQLDYLEAGLRFGFNRTLSLGFFYHYSKTNIENADDANWLSVNAQLGSILAKDRRIDLGFSYSSNVEGLRNIVGPIYEFSLTYHFKSSPACSLFGGVDPARSVICPPLAKTKKNKIYDNIWYQ